MFTFGRKSCLQPRLDVQPVISVRFQEAAINYRDYNSGLRWKGGGGSGSFGIF